MIWIGPCPLPSIDDDSRGCDGSIEPPNRLEILCASIAAILAIVAFIYA